MRWPLRRAITVLSGVVVLAACSGHSVTTARGALVPSAVTATTPASGPTRASSATVAAPAAPERLITCPSTYGVVPESTLPPAPRVPLPAAGAALAWYIDSARKLAPLLAPADWRCTIGVGADGGSESMVYAPGQAPSPGSPAGASQMIDVQAEPGCQGCAVQLACSLVPAAAAKATFFGTTCRPRAAAERVTWLAGSPDATTGALHDVVAFEDPPGVAGTGRPSGGSNPANGVLVYDYSPAVGSNTALETCTMPGASHALCTVILNDFVAREDN